MNQPDRYEYADGSANLYLLTPTHLRYLPVTPENSSTGMYSGGAPKTVSITESQFNQLKKLFDGALDNPAIHITDRIKTSGMISRMGSDTKQCIIKPHCAEMLQIETLLKSILN
jgi:hypothetical protein